MWQQQLWEACIFTAISLHYRKCFIHFGFTVGEKLSQILFAKGQLKCLIVQLYIYKVGCGD